MEGLGVLAMARVWHIGRTVGQRNRRYPLSTQSRHSGKRLKASGGRCRLPQSLLPVGLDQLLQAIGTEVAAETSSIADANAAAKTLVALRAEEKLANIGKKSLCDVWRDQD